VCRIAQPAGQRRRVWLFLQFHNVSLSKSQLFEPVLHFLEMELE
jgi:hypothetical protein